MNIKKFDNGMLAANCYVVDFIKKCIVIDPGVKSDDIIKYTNEKNLEIEYIIYTHAHIDHVLHGDELRDKTKAKVIIHEIDNPLLSDDMKNGALLFGLNNKFGEADILVKDKDTITIEGYDIEIIHTPGHTPGGICIKIDNIVFSGDTLFYNSIGRTDLGAGDTQDLMNSIKNKLFKLDGETIVYPGHGKHTIIQEEKDNNMFVY